MLDFIYKVFLLLKGDPKTSIARYILYSGVALSGIGTIIVRYKNNNETIFFEFIDDMSYLGNILIILGVFLLVIRFFQLKRNAVTLAYGKGMGKKMDSNEPKYALPKYEQYDAIDLNLGDINSYDKNEVIKYYNFFKKLTEDRTFNKNSKKLYVGSLGSFPYLFLTGSLFVDAYSQINLLDYERHGSGEGGKWYSIGAKFSTENVKHVIYNSQEQTLEEKIHALKNSDAEEIGIALAYTFPIYKESISDQTLQENTIYLKNSFGYKHDSLCSESLQKDLLNELSVIMGSLSSSKKKIHLFVSAQASFCINIGKSYMKNAHGTLVLHNYNNKEGTYDWSIEFSQGNIII